MVYLYALIAGSSDFLSGWLALRVERDKIEPRYVIAFAAGVLLAVTFFEILPEANLKSDSGFLALGFITFYLLEKIVMIHACGEAECHTHQIGPIAKPRQIMIVPELPKTRSGKIMRRLLRDVAENREVGDVTTLADSSVMELISQGLSSSTDD